MRQGAAGLNVFDGQNPNGPWTLFAADLEGGSLGVLRSWGLQITPRAVDVPEPAAGLVTGFLLLTSAGAFRWWTRNRHH